MKDNTYSFAKKHFCSRKAITWQKGTWPELGFGHSFAFIFPEEKKVFSQDIQRPLDKWSIFKKEDGSSWEYAPGKRINWSSDITHLQLTGLNSKFRAPDSCQHPCHRLAKAASPSLKTTTRGSEQTMHTFGLTTKIATKLINTTQKWALDYKLLRTCSIAEFIWDWQKCFSELWSQKYLTLRLLNTAKLDVVEDSANKSFIVVNSFTVLELKSFPFSWKKRGIVAAYLITLWTLRLCLFFTGKTCF